MVIFDNWQCMPFLFTHRSDSNVKFTCTRRSVTTMVTVADVKSAVEVVVITVEVVVGATFMEASIVYIVQANSDLNRNGQINQYYSAIPLQK